MFSAVFHQEMLLAGRRQRAYFLRWVYAALLLTQVLSIADLNQHATYASFFASFLTLHFAMLFMLTPALTAGAITDEKTRGTLALLLTAHLRPMEIVVGKLLGRAYQIIVVALVGLPLATFFGTLGDFDRWFAPALLAVSLILIVSLAAIAMLASVWCRQTRDAVLVTYLVLLAGFVLTYFPWTSLLHNLDPWRAVALYNPAQRGPRLLRFALGWLVPGAVCLMLAAWRLRRAYLKQLGTTTRTRRRWWQASRRRVRGNPVAWRERCVQGIAPLAWMRALPRWAGLVAMALASVGGLTWMVTESLPAGVPAAFREGGLPGVLDELHRLDAGASMKVVITHALLAMAFLTLVVAIRASGSITEERERGTWDGVLLTPMPTRQIVRGKWWGILQALYPYLACYGATTIPLAWLLGWQAGLCSIGALCAVGTTILAVAAVGVCCSAYLHSSWRSLIVTLVATYAVSQIFPLLATVIAGALVFCGCGCLALIENLEAGADRNNTVAVGQIVVPFVMLGVYFACTWLFCQNFLDWAEQRINKLERTKVLPLTDAAIRRWLERVEARQREIIAQDNAPIPLADDP